MWCDQAEMSVIGWSERGYAVRGRHSCGGQDDGGEEVT